jgi:hypothetical protein
MIFLALDLFSSRLGYFKGILHSKFRCVSQFLIAVTKYLRQEGTT